MLLSALSEPDLRVSRAVYNLLHGRRISSVMETEPESDPAPRHPPASCLLLLLFPPSAWSSSSSSVERGAWLWQKQRNAGVDCSKEPSRLGPRRCNCSTPAINAERRGRGRPRGTDCDQVSACAPWRILHPEVHKWKHKLLLTANKAAAGV